jgi:hypothetical protein
VTLAIAILVQSYRWAGSDHFLIDHKLDNAAGFMAWPAVILLGPAILASMVTLAVMLFGLAFNLLSDGTGTAALLREDLHDLLPLAIGMAVCSLYYLACKAVVRGTQPVARAWRVDNKG